MRTAELNELIEKACNRFEVDPALVKSPRPYSLDPNSKEYEYKVPEVGEYIDWWDTDAVKHGICWEHIYQELIDRKYLIGYLWLPSRTKDDFGR